MGIFYSILTHIHLYCSTSTSMQPHGYGYGFKYILYYFDQFGHHVSQGKWIWPKSVACPRSQRQWLVLKNHWSKIPNFFKPYGHLSGRAALTIGLKFLTGWWWSFVQLVTGHTLDRIDWNSRTPESPLRGMSREKAPNIWIIFWPIFVNLIWITQVT